MFRTFLCPDTCGFAKVAALEIENQVRNDARNNDKILHGGTNYDKKHISRQEQYKLFNANFNNNGQDKFQINFSKYYTNVKKLRSTVKKWNFRKSAEKKEYLKTFSLKKWKKLSEERKNEHKLSNCRGCAVRYAAIQAFFPVKSQFLKARTKSNAVLCAHNEARRLKSPSLKGNQRDISNSAKAIYKAISPAFKDAYGTSFSEALASVPESQLQVKNTPNHDHQMKRKQRRAQYKKAKENIEDQMKQSAFLR